MILMLFLGMKVFAGDTIQISAPPGYIVDEEKRVLYTLDCKQEKCFYYIFLKEGVYVYCDKRNKFRFLFFVNKEGKVGLPQR